MKEYEFYGFTHRSEKGIYVKSQHGKIYFPHSSCPFDEEEVLVGCTVLYDKERYGFVSMEKIETDPFNAKDMLGGDMVYIIGDYHICTNTDSDYSSYRYCSIIPKGTSMICPIYNGEKFREFKAGYIRFSKMDYIVHTSCNDSYKKKIQFDGMEKAIIDALRTTCPYFKFDDDKQDICISNDNNYLVIKQAFGSPKIYICYSETENLCEVHVDDSVAIANHSFSIKKEISDELLRVHCSTVGCYESGVVQTPDQTVFHFNSWHDYEKDMDPRQEEWDRYESWCNSVRKQIHGVDMATKYAYFLHPKKILGIYMREEKK